jgi:hypothetical protein
MLNKNQEIKKTDKTSKLNINIKSLDIDKAEYQEIVLSNTNFPDRDYFKQNYYD